MAKISVRQWDDPELNRALQELVRKINDALEDQGPAHHDVSRKPRGQFGKDGDTAFDRVNGNLYVRVKGDWKQVSLT